MRIEVNGKTYEVQKPVGRIGAIHMALIMEMEVPEDPEKVSAEERLRMQRSMANVFVRWAEQVLPKICKDYASMPGEDQYAVFLRLLEETRIPEELFRGSGD